MMRQEAEKKEPVDYVSVYYIGNLGKIENRIVASHSI